MEANEVEEACVTVIVEVEAGVDVAAVVCF